MNTLRSDIKHILLVEDDPRDAQLTMAALDELHLANGILVVHDGAEALDYLYRRGKFKGRLPGNPVVVLLDNKMPKVSGLEVLKTMKADVELKTIPVVVLTSSRETSDSKEFYQLGVNSYVVKPVDLADFVAAVKAVGAFWGTVNERPHETGRKEAAGHSGRTVLLERKGA
jgi:CheY-like chemotaxis protein